MTSPTGGRRAPTWLPVVGALAVVLLVGLVILLAGPGKNRTAGSGTDSSGALVCPTTYDLDAGIDWVPLVPSGVDGSKRLAPTVAPSHATVCRYDGSGAAVRDAVLGKASTDVGLRASATLDGGAEALAAQLSSAPATTGGTAHCLVRGDSVTVYLLGLTYRTGTVWVSTTASDCAGSTNGDFRSGTGFAVQAATALTSGSWPAS